MNILPHKSWHVRTKKNIERVRRDEEKAAEAEKEKQRKIALAEQEARTSLLKSRVKRSIGHVPNLESVSASHEKAVPVGPSSQCVAPGTDSRQVCIPGLGDRAEHINFFKDIEDGLKKQGKNKEHEAEKKKEQEELEKKIGLLTYLGQSVLEGTEKSSPWDLKKSLKREEGQVKMEESNQEEDKGEQLRLAMEARQKSFLDPLMEMKEYVDKKKKKHRHKEHRHKDKRKSSKDKTKSSSSKSSVSSSNSSPPKKTIDQLRAERLARENQERLKVKALMDKTKTGGLNERRKDESDSDSEVESRGVKRKYNSQYNPEFVRQPKPKKSRKEFF